MFPRVLQFAALLQCCSSLLYEAMLKRKRDLGLLNMLQGIDDYLDGDLAHPAVNKDEITRMMHEYDDVETPFGQIVSSFEFCPTPTDEPERINYLNPFALLWWLSQISYDFFTYLSKALPARIGRTVFYTDEVFPANSERRPDKGRAYYAFFWSN